jgi:hypothetical protein
LLLPVVPLAELDSTTGSFRLETGLRDRERFQRVSLDDKMVKIMAQWREFDPMSKAMSSAPGGWTSTREGWRGHMTDSENEKEVTKLSTVEHFHTAARLRELEAEATTPWVKQYLRSLIEERERMAGEQEALEVSKHQAVLE